MIGRIVRGTKVGGLIRYLYGPGRAGAPHTDPHLVGCWDGAPEQLDPGATRSGGREFRPLIAALEAPLAYAEGAAAQPVWHCSLRTAPEDRTLTDAEWAAAAADVLERTGIAPEGDDGGCRFVVVRHAEDHVHIVAVLARQDAARFRPEFDFLKTRSACRTVEERLALRRTAAADGTVPPRPTRAETEKAARLSEAGGTVRRPSGRGAAVLDSSPPGAAPAPWPSGPGSPEQGKRVPRPAREQLRARVRRAAAAAVGEGEFLGLLRAGGLIVTERRGKAGDLTGYAVALPGDVDVTGRPIPFGGGKLAADLSLPKLRAAWALTADAVGEMPIPAAERPTRAAGGDAGGEGSADPIGSRRPSGDLLRGYRRDR